MTIIMDKETFFNNFLIKINKKEAISERATNALLIEYIEEVKPTYNKQFINGLLHCCHTNPFITLEQCISVAVQHFVNKFHICSLKDKNNNLLFFYI